MDENNSEKQKRLAKANNYKKQKKSAETDNQRQSRLESNRLSQRHSRQGRALARTEISQQDYLKQFNNTDEDQLQANVCKCIALRSCFKLKDDNSFTLVST